MKVNAVNRSQECKELLQSQGCEIANSNLQSQCYQYIQRRERNLDAAVIQLKYSSYTKLSLAGGWTVWEVVAVLLQVV
jgi:spermidine synthase